MFICIFTDSSMIIIFLTEAPMEPTVSNVETGTATERKADNPAPSENSSGSYYYHVL